MQVALLALPTPATGQLSVGGLMKTDFHSEHQPGLYTLNTVIFPQ